MDISHRRSYRAYLVALAGLLAAGMLMATAINLVVDPYGVWRLVEIPGFNASKSERREQNYLFKAADLMRLKPDVLLMGSSRVAFGLDPENPQFAAHGFHDVYNAALTGGHMHAQRRYLEYAIQHDPNLKLIIWGLDFFAFSEGARLADTYVEDRFDKDRLPFVDIASVLWSLDALRASARTVQSNQQRPGYQPYFDNGQLTAMDMAEQVKRTGMKSRIDQSLRLYLNSPTRLPTYKDSPDAWAALRHVLELAEQHDIEVRIFVAPVHAAMLEAIRQRDHWDDYHAWLRQLAEYHDYWDFSPPTALTTEPISNDVKNYWDVSHYRSRIGDRIIGCLLSNGSRCDWDGRVLVGAQSLDEHLADLDARIRAWESAHPKDVDFVRARRR